MAHLLYFKTSNTFHIVVTVDFRKMHCSMIDFPKTLHKCVGFHFITSSGVWAATFYACGKTQHRFIFQHIEEE